MIEKTWYKCEEVAERYGVKVSTVWKWCRSGKIEASRIGRLYRIHKDALKKFETEKE